MKITKSIEVFDPNVLSPGSKIKLNGHSVMAEKTFNDDIVVINDSSHEEILFKFKGRYRTVQHWETLCDLEVEMIEHKPVEPKPLPF
jgi:hypothetical protein